MANSVHQIIACETNACAAAANAEICVAKCFSELVYLPDNPLTNSTYPDGARAFARPPLGRSTPPEPGGIPTMRSRVKDRTESPIVIEPWLVIDRWHAGAPACPHLMLAALCFRGFPGLAHAVL